MRTRTAMLILAGSAALAGCAYGYGDYGPYGGLSMGLGYGDYGYGDYYGGYGYGYPYAPYGGYGYPGYYGGFGAPYFGWYDNYYYPGTGIYVYDSYRRPHVWSDTQQRYWTQQRTRALSTTRTASTTTTRPVLRDNWSGFNRQTATDRATARTERREARQEERAQRRENNPHP